MMIYTDVFRDIEFQNRSHIYIKCREYMAEQNYAKIEEAINNNVSIFIINYNKFLDLDRLSPYNFSLILEDITLINADHYTRLPIKHIYKLKIGNSQVLPAAYQIINNSPINHINVNGILEFDYSLIPECKLSNVPISRDIYSSIRDYFIRCPNSTFIFGIFNSITIAIDIELFIDLIGENIIRINLCINNHNISDIIRILSKIPTNTMLGLYIGSEIEEHYIDQFVNELRIYWINVGAHIIIRGLPVSDKIAQYIDEYAKVKEEIRFKKVKAIF